MERRQAHDGQWYTYKEFSDYYGHAGPRKWDDAQPVFDDAGNTGRQQEAVLEHSNLTPLAEESHRKLLNRTGSRLTGRFQTGTRRTGCTMEPLEPEPDGTGTVGTGFWGIHWDQKTQFWARRHLKIF